MDVRSDSFKNISEVGYVLLLRLEIPRLFLWINVLLQAIQVLRKSENAHEVVVPICNVSSMYSALACLNVACEARFWRILDEMKSMVKSMEDMPGQKVWVDRARRSTRRVAKGLLTMSMSICLGIWSDMWRTGTTRLTSDWPFVPYAGRVGGLLAGVWYGVVAVVVVLIAISYVLLALSSLTIAACGSHLALAQRLARAETPEEIRELVILHQKLRGLTLDMTDFFSGRLISIMASSFTNSLVSTIQVLANDVSSFTFGLMVPVVTNFIPLSFLSQQLSDSSLACKWAAYRAATSDIAGHKEARALILVMLAAGRPPALRCNGLGELSLRAAGSALRQFYSAVNVLGSRLYA